MPSPTLAAATPIPLPLASQAKRSKLTWLLLFPSVILTGIAWFFGGHSPFLTDLGFLWLTLSCIGLVITEIRHFRERRGWGAIVMYGGVVIWFCHDYMKQWNTTTPFIEGMFGWHGTAAKNYPEALPTIAWMAFLHCLFVTLMSVGFSFRVPDRVTRLIFKYPEPRSFDFLFWIAMGGLACNLAFYALFSYAGLYETLFAAYFGGRHGQIGVSVGFSDNLTTSFSSYFQLLADAIGLGGTAGAAYAVFVRKSVLMRTAAALVFAHAMMLAYGSGTRSAVASQGAPLVAFLVVRAMYQPAFLRRALGIIFGMGLILAAMIQLQTHYRNQAYDIDFKDNKLTSEVQGNTMFSEALDAYMDIPEHRPFFHNNQPGEGAIRAIPQMFFWFAIGPIPRPLWHDKPIDPAWSYRARSMDTTEAQNNMGTTLSYGLVGAWYFRFGFAGVIEGALLMGWLYAITERMIRSVSAHRLHLLRLAITLTILGTLLLFYRDVVFFGVWRLVVIFAVVAVFIRYILPRNPTD